MLNFLNIVNLSMHVSNYIMYFLYFNIKGWPFLANGIVSVLIFFRKSFSFVALQSSVPSAVPILYLFNLNGLIFAPGLNLLLESLPFSVF